MSSPLRKTWQDCKKQMGVPDKAFKQDLGPNLDKAQDAFDAVVDKMDKKAPGVANALKCLNDIITHFQHQEPC